MPKQRDEETDLALVRQLLFDPNKLEATRFDREELLKGRTPDFRVVRDGKLAGYAEIKSPRDDKLDELLAGAAPGEIVQLLRDDPIFNRLGRHVAKAATQFDAVNPDHALPNVLAFVNHDSVSTYADMRETLTGMYFAESGKRYPTMMRVAEEWLGQAKRKIDLFVWIDAHPGRIVGYVDNEISGHQARINELFGLGKFPRIPQAVWSRASKF